jgi:N-acetylmuramoyl-L-alanine amidase
MRPINEIVVHCTATRAEWWATRSLAQKVAEVRLWHTRDRGWRDIGYHYLIDRDGKVASGRPVEQVGAHVQGRNTGTIGVALFGGHGGATTDRFSDHFTPAQDAALRRLLTDLSERFPAITKISGHHEYAAKACPCFNVRQWLAEGDFTPAPSRPVAAPPLTANPVGASEPPVQQRQTPLAAFLAWLASVFVKR